MNIKRLEVIALSALFLGVMAILPPWQMLGLRQLSASGSGCGHLAAPAAQVMNFTLAAELKGLPRLIIGALIFAFLFSLMMNWFKMKKECQQKEMYSCATCSTPYEQGSKFCHSCGAEL